MPEGEERGGNEVQYLKEDKSQAFDYASDRFSLFKTIETLHNFTPGSRPWSRVWKRLRMGCSITSRLRG